MHHGYRCALWIVKCIMGMYLYMSHVKPNTRDLDFMYEMHEKQNKQKNFYTAIIQVVILVPISPLCRGHEISVHVNKYNKDLDTERLLTLLGSMLIKLDYLQITELKLLQL